MSSHGALRARLARRLNLFSRAGLPDDLLFLKGSAVIFEFRNDGDFAAMQAAEAWCAAHGISVGVAQDHWPRGLFIGSASIAKWRNLSPTDRETLHGVMLGSLRHGPIRIVLYDQRAQVQHLLEQIAAQPVPLGAGGRDGMAGQSDCRRTQRVPGWRARWPVRRKPAAHEAAVSTAESAADSIQ